jgi:hypothetical protein
MNFVTKVHIRILNSVILIWASHKAIHNILGDLVSLFKCGASSLDTEIRGLQSWVKLPDPKLVTDLKSSLYYWNTSQLS